MTRLLDDLLDVSRIAMGKITLRKEELDLTEIVERAGEDHRPLLETRGLTLSVSAPRETVYILGDAARVTQIVGNLLVNAGKFTDRGGRVDVTLEVGGGRQAVIRVRDTGIGIDTETMSRLFQPFAQADRSMHRSGGGLGLGLALVKGLAELHGGHAQATSGGTGLGAEFVVSLPGAVLRSVTVGLQEAGAVHPQRPQRILVVEDNHDAAESLKDWLELSGNSVLVAHSGPAGLELARSCKPDVVLCDIGLPGMNGYEVATAIRNAGDLRSVCLIAMTGYGLDEDRRRALEAGFDHHLTKPVDPWVLERLLGLDQGDVTSGASLYHFIAATWRLNSASRRRVTAPGRPSPIWLSFTVTMGTISRVVLVRNISSAPKRSASCRVVSRTVTPHAVPTSKTNALVMPASRPASIGGVSTSPALTTNRFDCEHSEISLR